MYLCTYKKTLIITSNLYHVPQKQINRIRSAAIIKYKSNQYSQHLHISHDIHLVKLTLNYFLLMFKRSLTIYSNKQIEMHRVYSRAINKSQLAFRKVKILYKVLVHTKSRFGFILWYLTSNETVLLNSIYQYHVTSSFDSNKLETIYIIRCYISSYLHVYKLYSTIAKYTV